MYSPFTRNADLANTNTSVTEKDSGRPLSNSQSYQRSSQNFFLLKNYDFLVSNRVSGQTKLFSHWFLNIVISNMRLVFIFFIQSTFTLPFAQGPSSLSMAYFPFFVLWQLIFLASPLSNSQESLSASMVIRGLDCDGEDLCLNPPCAVMLLLGRSLSQPNLPLSLQLPATKEEN